MIINPTGRKIIRLVFFMVFFFFFFLPVHDLPAISCILLHSLASSCILLHYPARAPDSHKTISSFISFFLLSLYILLPKAGRENAFEDQYHENRDVQKKTCFRSFLSFFGIKADISGSIGKQNGKIEPMCYWVTTMIPVAFLQVRQNRRHSVFSPLFPALNHQTLQSPPGFYFFISPAPAFHALPTCSPVT